MVIVITGLILAGKSTLAKQLMEWGYQIITEYTTRPMRPGEVDGKDYHYIDDGLFDEMEESGQFAECFHVRTVHGLWKYGAKKEDLKDGCILVCGPNQMKQVLSSDIGAISVLLDIDRGTAMARAARRGDDLTEVDRRFAADSQVAEELKGVADLVLDARDSTYENAKAIDRFRAVKTGTGYMRSVEGRPVVTAQEMDEGELNFYLSGDDKLTPYLRLKDNGMPKNPVSQIAWLLLSGSGCGFCKVCRPEPCNIKDGEKCTKNIADYIRACVHAEDEERSGTENE